MDLISFTGSTAVGMRIMEGGGATLKRTFLELGGKSATIVLDDADFATSVPSGIAVCFHAGQGCAIQTRMLLPRSRYEEGVEILKATLSSVAYGDPQQPDVLMGPVISAKQRERVLGYIAKGVEEGATLALGGGRPAHLPKGWFVEPTLFTDVDNSMTIAQEEIFGPVLVTIPYDDDDDAVRIANDSVYGLSGGVFSGSLDRAISVAERIRTGSLAVNGGMPIGQADMPFGGYKHSGIGRQTGWPASTSTSRRSRSPGRRRSSRASGPGSDRSGGGRTVTGHDPVLRQHGYHQLRVKEVVRETHDASSFVLDVPPDLAETFTYRPGQFCTFRVHVDGEEQLRSYSMSSTPGVDEDLTVTVKRVAGGVVSNFFLDHIAAGDVVELTKPAGVFCPEDSERTVVGLCGGSGITPVMSIAKHMLATSARPVRLLYANRDASSVIFKDALAALQVAYPGRLDVRHHHDSADGFLAPADVAGFVGPDFEADFYICGPGPFMDLAETVLAGGGWPPSASSLSDSWSNSRRRRRRRKRRVTTGPTPKTCPTKSPSSSTRRASS